MVMPTVSECANKSNVLKVKKSSCIFDSNCYFLLCFPNFLSQHAMKSLELVPVSV